MALYLTEQEGVSALPRYPKGSGRASPSNDLGYHTLHGSGWSDADTCSAASHMSSPCPFDRLPDDVLLKVLECLSTSELCRCARVCRRWYFLVWEPQLWTSITLCSDKLPVDQGLRTLFRLLGRDAPGVCATVERVALNGCTRLTDRGLSSVARRCPQLRVLEARGCSMVSDAGIAEVVSRCLNLERLDLTGCYQVTCIQPCPATGVASPLSGQSSGRGCNSAAQHLYLQYMDLTDCQGLEDGGVKILVKHYPHLTHLFLRRCLRITDAAIKYIASCCVMLKELSISDCLQVTDFGLYELAKLGPHLRYLSIAKCDQVSDAGVKQVCRHCYKLRYLNVRGCEAVSDASLEVLARSCPRLRALDVGKCQIGDRGLSSLARHCPNLRKLSLKSCDRVTDHGLHAVASLCCGLQRLNVQDCPSITVEGYRVVRHLCQRCIIEHTNPGFQG